MRALNSQRHVNMCKHARCPRIRPTTFGSLPIGRTRLGVLVDIKCDPTFCWGHGCRTVLRDWPARDSFFSVKNGHSRMNEYIDPFILETIMHDAALFSFFNERTCRWMELGIAAILYLFCPTSELKKRQRQDENRIEESDLLSDSASETGQKRGSSTWNDTTWAILNPSIVCQVSGEWRKGNQRSMRKITKQGLRSLPIASPSDLVGSPLRRLSSTS